MELNDVNPELLEKAKACKSSEELMVLAKEEGYELSADELDSIAGGWGENCDKRCNEYQKKRTRII